jgi:hypothetical protein
LNTTKRFTTTNTTNTTNEGKRGGATTINTIPADCQGGKFTPPSTTNGRLGEQ